MVLPYMWAYDSVSSIAHRSCASRLPFHPATISPNGTFLLYYVYLQKSVLVSVCMSACVCVCVCNLGNIDTPMLSKVGRNRTHSHSSLSRCQPFSLSRSLSLSLSLSLSHTRKIKEIFLYILFFSRLLVYFSYSHVAPSRAVRRIFPATLNYTFVHR